MGLARKGIENGRPQSLGSRGGANRASVARLAQRLKDAQREGEDLRLHSASLRQSLDEANRRADREREEDWRAESDARQARVRADDSERRVLDLVDELRQGPRKRPQDWDDGGC